MPQHDKAESLGVSPTEFQCLNPEALEQLKERFGLDIKVRSDSPVIEGMLQSASHESSGTYGGPEDDYAAREFIKKVVCTRRAPTKSASLTGGTETAKS
jgi:hypothetical protein